jgi:hypothetical protein
VAKNSAGILMHSLLPASPFRAAVQIGMGALTRQDRHLFIESERTKISDSLDLDSALRPSDPQGNRWDYLLGIRTVQQIIAVEPHSTRDREINVVIAKKRSAQRALLAHLPPAVRVKRWIWVSRSSPGFGRMERATRLLDQAGIEFVAKIIRSVE